jgi:hypothetical protein
MKRISKNKMWANKELGADTKQKKRELENVK